jgi:hypothetical protein
VGKAEQDEIRALFQQVFGRPMSEALWRWKYAEGRGCASGVRLDEQAWGESPEAVPEQPQESLPARLLAPLLAHYGGTARALCLGQTVLAGVQIGDSMVRPDVRGVLSRSGPFALAARHFINERVGDGLCFAIGFGFPNARHARLGELLGLYRALGEVRELGWPAAPASGQAAWRWQLAPLVEAGRAVDPRAWAKLDRLWERMRSALPDWLIAQRDADWCRHRYLDHPHHRYRVDSVRCRYTGKVLGVVVLRVPPADTPAPDGWELMDWIGEPRNLPLAIAVTRAEAANRGVPWLRGWFSAPLIERHTQHAGEPAATPVCTWCVTARRSAGVPPGLDAAPWWLTGGDTEFR